MNLLQLRTSMSYYLDDDSDARWQPTEKNYYINRAARYYWDKLVTHKYQGIMKSPGAYGNIVANQDYVALPADLHTIDTVYRVYDNRKVPMMYFVNFEDTLFTQTSDDYVPSYSFRGNNIVLTPTPASNVTNGILFEYYPFYTDLVSDSDIISGFKPHWQDMIALKAACIAKSGREEEDISTLKGMDLNEVEAEFLMGLKLTHARTRVNPFIIY